jgi:hypothetical protein
MLEERFIYAFMYIAGFVSGGMVAYSVFSEKLRRSDINMRLLKAGINKPEDMCEYDAEMLFLHTNKVDNNIA